MGWWKDYYWQNRIYNNIVNDVYRRLGNEPNEEIWPNILCQMSDKTWWSGSLLWGYEE